MGWFRKKPDPMTVRARELNAEITNLKFEIDQLNDTAGFSSSHQIQTLPKERILQASTRTMKTDGKSKKSESVETGKEINRPSLYNDQGLRKFNLAGYWQKITHGSNPKPTKNEELVTLIATSRQHGHTALRRDTRLARRRFILLTLVLLAVLWSVLSLLIPQL